MSVEVPADTRPNDVHHNRLFLLDANAAWRVLSETQKFLHVPTTFDQHDPRKSTRISCMSDTHGKHRLVKIPKCDVLIHGGDFSQNGEEHAITDIADFFEEVVQERIAKKVICIAGNHDTSFHPGCYLRNLQKIKHWDREMVLSEMDKAADVKQYLKARCAYLEDESCIENTKFYGSPWSPKYSLHWAFNKERDEIHTAWDLIPNDTDVLITHGPPIGRGDKVHNGIRAGCVNLLEQTQHRIVPRLHISGHIHEDSGCTFDGYTLFVNASNCSIRCRPVQPCIVIDLPHDLSEGAKVVIPKCTFDGSDVLKWLKSRGYDTLYPYFEKRKPLLRGKDLVTEDLDLDHVANTLRFQGNQKLDKNTRKALLDLKQKLAQAIMHLRSESYL